MHIRLQNIIVSSRDIQGQKDNTRLNLSCELNTTEKIGIAGLSGSGKTTLLQVLAGMLETDAGELYLDGENVFASKALLKRYQSLFAMCFQFPEIQLFEHEVSMDIAFGLKNTGVAADEMNNRVDNILKDIGFSHEQFKHKSIRSLSQGEKRRVAIAGVAVMDKPVLLLDEPTAGLDAKSRDKIQKILLRYAGRQEKGMVVISHDLQFLLKIVDRLWLMENGMLVCEMDCKNIDYEYLSNFIELPRAYYLKKRLVELGLESALI